MDYLLLSYYWMLDASIQASILQQIAAELAAENERLESEQKRVIGHMTECDCSLDWTGSSIHSYHLYCIDCWGDFDSDDPVTVEDYQNGKLFWRTTCSDCGRSLLGE